MPYSYRAPAGGGGGGGAVEQGWRRFLLVGADYTDDPHSQADSITEDDDETAWTSLGSGTLATAESKRPDNGAIYTRALVDANGDALAWDRPFSVDFLIELTEVGSYYKQGNSYFGFGLSGVTTGLDAASSIGVASTWNATGSSNYQRTYRFKKNSWDNQGSVNETWDTGGTIIHGPRHGNQGAHQRLMSYRFNPTNPSGSGDTGIGNYPLGSSKLPSTGAVYGFVTCGRTQTWGTVKTLKFRIYYAVTGSTQDWTP